MQNKTLDWVPSDIANEISEGSVLINTLSELPLTLYAL